MSDPGPITARSGCCDGDLRVWRGTEVLSQLRGCRVMGILAIPNSAQCPEEWEPGCRQKLGRASVCVEPPGIEAGAGRGVAWGSLWDQEDTPSRGEEQKAWRLASAGWLCGNSKGEMMQKRVNRSLRALRPPDEEPRGQAASR